MRHDEAVAEVHVQDDADVVRVHQTARLLALALGLRAAAQARFAAMAAQVAAYLAAECHPTYVRFWVGMSDERRHGLGLDVSCRRRDGTRLTPEALPPALSGAVILAGQHIVAESEAGTSLWLHEPLLPGELIAGSAIDALRVQLGHSARCVAVSFLRRQHQDLLARLLVLQQRHRLARSQAAPGGGVSDLYAALDAHAGELARVAVSGATLTPGESLRRPLASIQALTARLLALPEHALTPEQHTHLRLIHEASAELLGLIGELQDQACVESGPLVAYHAEFDVAQLYGSLEAAFAALDLRPQVGLCFEKPAAGQHVLCSDRHKVAQVLRELIINALRFTLRGTVRVSSRGAGDAVRLEVADTGIGITAGELGVLLREQGAQPAGTRRRKVGDGLGLAFARRLASVIGARLDVTSQPDAGSVFALVLPAGCIRQPD